MKKPNSRLPLKLRQQQILILLYRFRFLNTRHIQTILKHKQKQKIILWLNDLTEQNYIYRFYTKRFAGEAAVYCLTTVSRRYLKQKIKEQKAKEEQTDIAIKESLLKRIYREKKLSQTFRNHCLFIADISLSLERLVKTTGATLTFYTKTDLHGMKYLMYPTPDAYFSITEAKGSVKRYFLDIFDDLPPRMILRRRVRQYFRYYEEGDWQEYNKNPFPEIILVAPDDRSKNYLKRFIKKQLQDEEKPHFFLSTWQQIKEHGIRKEVLEKITNQEKKKE